MHTVSVLISDNSLLSISYDDSSGTNLLNDEVNTKSEFCNPAGRWRCSQAPLYCSISANNLKSSTMRI